MSTIESDLVVKVQFHDMGQFLSCSRGITCEVEGFTVHGSLTSVRDISVEFFLHNNKNGPPEPEPEDHSGE